MNLAQLSYFRHLAKIQHSVVVYLEKKDETYISPMTVAYSRTMSIKVLQQLNRVLQSYSSATACSQAL